MPHIGAPLPGDLQKCDTLGDNMAELLVLIVVGAATGLGWLAEQLFRLKM